jgi:restriction system protein
MLPSFSELIDPLLKLISKAPQTRKNATLELEKLLKISREQMDIKSNSGTFIFENRVGWAFTYLTKAEYIKKSTEKALYEITDLGSSALKDSHDNNLIIDESYLKVKSLNYLSNWQVNRSEKNQANTSDPLNDKILTATEFEMNLEESIDQFNRQFEDELLNKIKNLSWQDFEDLCSRLIEKMGYGVSSTRTIRARDGGIDGEIFEDELGINGVIYIQAKRYDNNNISVNDIKNFLHTINKNKGIFITTSDFTKDAMAEARSYRGRVALINKDSLIKYCKKYEIQCVKQTIDIFKII